MNNCLIKINKVLLIVAPFFVFLFHYSSIYFAYSLITFKNDLAILCLEHAFKFLNNSLNNFTDLTTGSAYNDFTYKNMETSKNYQTISYFQLKSYQQIIYTNFVFLERNFFTSGPPHLILHGIQINAF